MKNKFRSIQVVFDKKENSFVWVCWFLAKANLHHSHGNLTTQVVNTYLASFVGVGLIHNYMSNWLVSNRNFAVPKECMDLDLELEFLVNHCSFEIRCFFYSVGFQPGASTLWSKPYKTTTKVWFDSLIPQKFQDLDLLTRVFGFLKDKKGPRKNIFIVGDTFDNREQFAFCINTKNYVVVRQSNILSRNKS